jgi:hypothetical protein
LKALVKYLALALLLASSAASAQDEDEDEFELPDVSVTNTLIVEARTDNRNGTEGDDQYTDVLERLNLNLGWGDFEGWLRLDAALFVPWFEARSRMTPPPFSYSDEIEFCTPDKTEGCFQNNLRPERVGVAWNLGDWRLTAGDAFQQLGRGIVLAIRKVNEAGVDVALRGLHVDYEGDRVTAKAFGGVTNPANIDSVNQRFVADTNDVIAGGSFEISATDELNLGVFGAYTQPRETILPGELDLTGSAGAFVDAHSLLDWLSFYGEAAVQYRRLSGADQQGSALYGSTDARFGDLGIQLEGMWLNEFEQRGSKNTALQNRFSYNVPPTLERIDQQVANNRDVLGGRARIEYYFSDVDLLLYANGVYRLNEPARDDPLHTWHAFSGLQWTLPGGKTRLSSASGFRSEAQPPPGGGELIPRRNMVNVDFDWLQDLGSGWSLHATTQMQWWTFFRTESALVIGRPFDLGSQFVGIERSGLGGLTFELGADTFNQAPGVQNFFYAGIATWEIPSVVFFDLVDSATLRATVGSQRGGIKCVAGVCREFPAFSGARGELVTRF